MICVLVFFGFFIGKIRTFKLQSGLNQAYLAKVKKQIMQNFDPSKITKSGFCVISIEISEDGHIVKKQIEKSHNEEMVDSVTEMMTFIDDVEVPPESCVRTPIKFRIGCQMKETDISCYIK